MSSKKLLAFIVLVLIIILAVFSFFYSRNKKSEDTTNNTDSEFPISGDGDNNGFVSAPPTGDTNTILNPGEVFDSIGDIVKKEEAILRQITTEPVAETHISQRTITVMEDVASEDEEVTFTETEKEEYLVSFIQKNNGHVLIDSDREDDKKKILNQTIPQTEQGLLSDDFVLLQYLDTQKENIRSFGGILSVEDDQGEEKFTFENIALPNNVLSPSLSPDKKSLSFLVRTSTGTNVVISDVTNLEEAYVVYSTPLTDILLDWGSDDNLYLSSKSDSRAPGFVKRISGGESTDIISGINGLTFNVSPSGEIALISGTNTSSSQLSIYDYTSNRNFGLDIYTLPEKCTWSKINPTIAYCAGQPSSASGSFPQDWYQDKYNFSDTLWVIDTENLQFTEFYTFLGVDETFDITNLQLSPDENRLIFTNKNDSTPWILRMDS